MTTITVSGLEYPQLFYWREGLACCDEEWEAAYSQFETREQEVAKSLRRYKRLGVDRWERDLSIVDLFCGRGSGLLALEQLGFKDLEGVDLSPELLKQYHGSARLFVGDCRDLQFDDGAKDAFVVQGGLHHLLTLPGDLEAVVVEMRRALRPGGRVAIVEPWLTPFLRFVHVCCCRRWLRRAWPKLDSLGRMTERELDTYMRWLQMPEEILSLFDTYFDRERVTIAFGKLLYVGIKK